VKAAKAAAKVAAEKLGADAAAAVSKTSGAAMNAMTMAKTLVKMGKQLASKLDANRLELSNIVDEAVKPLAAKLPTDKAQLDALRSKVDANGCPTENDEFTEAIESTIGATVGKLETLLIDKVLTPAYATASGDAAAKFDPAAAKAIGVSASHVKSLATMLKPLIVKQAMNNIKDADVMVVKCAAGLLVDKFERIVKKKLA
jgi:hypothetical protein